MSEIELPFSHTVSSCRSWSSCNASCIITYGYSAGNNRHSMGWSYGWVWPISTNKMRKISGKRTIIILCIVADYIPEGIRNLRCSNSDKVLRCRRVLLDHHWRSYARRYPRSQQHHWRRQLPHRQTFLGYSIYVRGWISFKMLERC